MRRPRTSRKNIGAVDYISRISCALGEECWERINNLTINDRRLIHLGDPFHSPQTTCTSGFLSASVRVSE